MAKKIDIAANPKKQEKKVKKAAKEAKIEIPVTKTIKKSKKIHLDHNLVKKASQILIENHNKNKNTKNLLENSDQFLYLELNLNKVPDHFSIRPIQMLFIFNYLIIIFIEKYLIQSIQKKI